MSQRFYLRLLASSVILAQGHVIGSSEVPKPRLTLKGHTHWVFAVAIAPTGGLLASAGRDKTVKLWDLGTGREKATLRGHNGAVHALAFSLDGKILSSAGGGAYVIRLWDVATARTKAILRGHSRAILALAFSPDRKTLASGGEDDLIKLWDTGTGQEKGSIRGHPNRLDLDGPTSIRSLAFSPDGKKLASAGMANTTISMWNVNNTEKRALFAGNEVGGSVRCITFSPDGNTLASIGNGLVITLWDVVKRKRRMCLKVNGDYGVSCLTFSVDGKRLITGGNTKLRIWDVADGRERGAIRAHSTTITSIACSKDGKTLVSGSLDKVVRVWDMDALIYDKK